MSRLFDGVDDVITFGAGGAATLQNGALSLVYLIKIGSSHRGGLYDGRASGTRRIGLNPFDSGSGTAFFAIAGVGTVSVSYASLIGEWGILAFTKAAGSAQVRAHIYTYSGGTWSHTDIGNVPGNGSGTVDTIFLGSFDAGQFLNATVAAVGLWTGTALADLTIEGFTTALSAWKAANPSVLWRFNQSSTSDPVSDIMGSGADQSAITGTAVSASEPPGFSYSLGITQALGVASEVDTAQPLGRVKSRALGPASETDTARPLGRAKTRALGVAVETETAMPLGGSSAVEDWMHLGLVMDAIAAQLGTIAGLRVFAYPPATVTPPAAIVSYPERIDFDLTYRRGFDKMTMPVVVVVGKVSDRAARDALGAFCDSSGPKSIKAVVEAGNYSAFDAVRVESAEFDVLSIAGVDYMAALFTLDIGGSGS